MTIKLSEQMQKRRQQKFQRELSRVLSRATAKGLNELISKIFEYNTTKPTADEFVRMALSSKFGVGNCLTESDAEFCLETSLNAFNSLKLDGRLDKTVTQPWGSKHIAHYSSTDLWNVAFIYEIDSMLYPHVSDFQPEDFIWANDISPYLFLDKATQAFGFVIVPLPAMTIDEFKIYGTTFTGWEEKVQKWFDRTGYARLRIHEFDSGPMEYISAINMVFGPVDKLVACIPDRDRHHVVSHERKLQSGNVTTVRSHKRKTPLRLVVNNRTLTDHIVYLVRDSDGEVRYYGEGKRDRWKHVNSGASHNIKINEHFFLRGAMPVEVLYEGLTKSEALSIERMLIRKNGHTQLWNVKDYEPFELEADGQISRMEISNFSPHTTDA